MTAPNQGEGAAEDGREQGIQFGGGLGLKALQRERFRRQRVQGGWLIFALGLKLIVVDTAIDQQRL